MDHAGARDILTQTPDAPPRNASAVKRSLMIAATAVITYQFDLARRLLGYFVKPTLPLKITTQGPLSGPKPPINSSTA
jgi:hypothetical protein